MEKRVHHADRNERINQLLQARQRIHYNGYISSIDLALAGTENETENNMLLRHRRAPDDADDTDHTMAHGVHERMTSHMNEA